MHRPMRRTRCRIFLPATRTRRRPPIPKKRRRTRWPLNKARPRGGFGCSAFIQSVTANDGRFPPTFVLYQPALTPTLLAQVRRNRRVDEIHLSSLSARVPPCGGRAKVDFIHPTMRRVTLNADRYKSCPSKARPRPTARPAQPDWRMRRQMPPRRSSRPALDKIAPVWFGPSPCQR